MLLAKWPYFDALMLQTALIKIKLYIMNIRLKDLQVSKREFLLETLKFVYAGTLIQD